MSFPTDLISCQDDTFLSIPISYKDDDRTYIYSVEVEPLPYYDILATVT